MDHCCTVPRPNIAHVKPSGGGGGGRPPKRPLNDGSGRNVGHARNACDNCKKKKKRCIMESEPPCDQCLQKELNCRYTNEDGRTTRFQKQRDANATRPAIQPERDYHFAYMNGHNNEDHPLTASFNHLTMNEGTGNELQGYVNPPGARGPPAQYQTAANIAGTTSSRGEGTNGRYQLQLPGAGSSPGYDQAQDATYWDARAAITSSTNGYQYYNYGSQHGYYTTGLAFLACQPTSYERSAVNTPGAYLPSGRSNPGNHPVQQHYRVPPRHNDRNPEDEEYAGEDADNGTA